MLTPTTGLGRWSVRAVAAFAVFIGVFALTVASGQRGGEEFFDNLWLTVPFLIAYASGVAAFVVGAIAIARRGERSVGAILASVLGLLITAFGVLEVVVPH